MAVLNSMRHLLLGPPLPTQSAGEKRLNKVRALAAFSPDALSSIAYANQEIYLGLVVAGAAGLSLATPIALAISGLLIIVALSYFQTIAGYPSGGGSYVVARDNLGAHAGLIAAAALLIDYLLTAAVSLTAGVEAIASAFPALWQYRVLVSLLLLALITLLNLRGLRETGTVMSIPVYLFLLSYLPMLAYGGMRLLTTGSVPLTATAPAPSAPLTLFLVLRAFATGCTALTGVEAISNGVPAFQPPEARNARQTVLIMAALMGLLFLGSILLTQEFAVVAGPQETILSALAGRLLGKGPGYFLIQVSTMLILAVAANTSFAGFPRLAALMAADGYLPRQLTSVGDRLVFANGITLLAMATGVVIVIFGGDTHALIPLFAVGVFLAFTLSQAGMVIHWRRDGGRGWAAKATLNGVGAVVTAITLLIVGVSKFVEGAWLTILLIPILVAIFVQIRRHYQSVTQQLSLGGWSSSPKPFGPPRVVVPVSGVHRGMINAVCFAQSISPNVTGIYIESEAGTGTRISELWHARWPDVPLVVVPSPYRSTLGPLLDFLEETDRRHNDGRLAVVVLPEFVPAHWWQGVLHNQTALLIKTALLYTRWHRGYPRVVIDVPYHLSR
jgi:amino acid transporter